jgi:hypothetical protein
MLTAGVRLATEAAMTSAVDKNLEPFILLPPVNIVTCYGLTLVRVGTHVTRNGPAIPQKRGVCRRRLRYAEFS